MTKTMTMMMIKDISQPLRGCLNFSSGKRKTNISLPANWPRLPVEKHATQKVEKELYVFFWKTFLHRKSHKRKESSKKEKFHNLCHEEYLSNLSPHPDIQNMKEQ